MGGNGWKRVGGFAAVGFVVLSVLATFLYPQPPRVDSSAAKVLGWAHGHRVGIETAMALGIFASLLFICLAAYIRQVLVRAGEDLLATVAYGAGLAFAPIYALGAIPVAALVFMDGQPGGVTSNSLVRLLIDLNQILFAPATALSAVFLITTGLAIVRTGAIAPRLGRPAIGIGLVNAVEVVPVLTFSSYHAGAWTAVGWISYLGFLVLVLGLGVALLRREQVAVGMAAQPALSS